MADGLLVSIIVLVLINIAGVAYSYGKLSQKVEDLSRRVTEVERSVNGR